MVRHIHYGCPLLSRRASNTKNPPVHTLRGLMRREIGGGHSPHNQKCGPDQVEVYSALARHDAHPLMGAAACVYGNGVTPSGAMPDGALDQRFRVAQWGRSLSAGVSPRTRPEPGHSPHQWPLLVSQVFAPIGRRLAREWPLQPGLSHTQGFIATRSARPSVAGETKVTGGGPRSATATLQKRSHRRRVTDSSLPQTMTDGGCR